MNSLWASYRALQTWLFKESKLLWGSGSSAKAYMQIDGMIRIVTAKPHVVMSQNLTLSPFHRKQSLRRPMSQNPVPLLFTSK